MIKLSDLKEGFVFHYVNAVRGVGNVTRPTSVLAHAQITQVPDLSPACYGQKIRLAVLLDSVSGPAPWDADVTKDGYIDYLYATEEEAKGFLNIVNASVAAGIEYGRHAAATELALARAKNGIQIDVHGNGDPVLAAFIAGKVQTLLNDLGFQKTAYTCAAVPVTEALFVDEKVQEPEFQARMREVRVHINDKPQ